MLLRDIENRDTAFLSHFINHVQCRSGHYLVKALMHSGTLCPIKTLNNYVLLHVFHGVTIYSDKKWYDISKIKPLKALSAFN